MTCLDLHLDWGREPCGLWQTLGRGGRLSEQLNLLGRGDARVTSSSLRCVIIQLGRTGRAYRRAKVRFGRIAIALA